MTPPKCPNSVITALMNMEMLEMPDDLKHCSKIINELNKYMTKIKMPIQDLENKLGNLNKNQQKDFKEGKS